MGKARFIPVVMAVTMVGAMASGAAFAKEHEDRNDAAAVSKAKISMAQAITAAEQQVSGKATGADLEARNGVVRYSVEVATDQGMKTVLVDAQTGKTTLGKAGGEGGEHDAEDDD